MMQPTNAHELAKAQIWRDPDPHSEHVQGNPAARRHDMHQRHRHDLLVAADAVIAAHTTELSGSPSFAALIDAVAQVRGES